MLYDLEADPGETWNLADERPEVAAALKERLLRWVAAGGAGSGAPEAVRIEPQAEEQLRSLGYIQ
jgi:hypothetical protein